MNARGIYMLFIRRSPRRLAIATVAVLALGLGPAGLAGAPSAARADDPVVRAVIFYSPACGHCHKVMTEDLPPLLEQHGDALQIAAIDVTPDDGQALYMAAVERFGLQDRLGVPTLIVGDEVMIGSAEIPARLPGLVDAYLAAGGVDWPDVPGLAAALATPVPATADPSAAAPATTDPVTSPDPANPATADPSASPAAVLPGPGDGTDAPGDDLAARLGRDPVANTLAILILAAMLVVVAWAAATALRSGGGIVARPPSVWIAALAVIGLGVAAYLAYVETAEVAAVCGPVGDCNTVQQSSYASLFGVLPIGVLGLAGYVGILGAWAVARRSGSTAARPARIALLAMAFGGTLFSIYLTFLEPFVIGAVCAWCLTSAVVMALLLAVAIRSMAAPRGAPTVSPAAPTLA